MARLNQNVLIYTALILAISAHVSSAAYRKFPPEGLLENPNFRTSRSLRADDNYRLPNDTRPLHYDVTLTTNVHTGDTVFTGIVKIDVEVLNATSAIVVHARQLTIESATILRKDVAGSTEVKLTSTFDEKLEFLKLTPTDGVTTFPKETNWTLTINYNGKLRSDNGGFYLSTFIDENNNTRYLATTQFESTDARHAFPCYDEPSKRATFEITIKHSPTYNAISNMPVNTDKTSDGVTAFQTTRKMSTYLLAFIVSDFVHSDGELNGLPQRVFSRKGSEHDQEWALTSGMLVEKRLAEYYDVPFALPKLDQAAIPDFAAGAMENWGLATYREEYLLYNPENSTTSTQTNIATIVSHEYAHMWFGDLVNIEWWTYLWLKEGFATLFEHLAVDLAYPEWDIFQTFQVGSYQSALNFDASPSSRPMTHYVQAPEEISQLYDSISYAKAGSVLDMWRHALTNKVFQRGLHNYLTANQFSSADEWKLFAGIGLAAKEENYALPATIEEMMSSWTHQKGYPLLTVTRNYESGTFVVKQEAFFNNETTKEEKWWYVPINYAVQSNPDFRSTEATHYLLKQPQLNVTGAKISNDDWLILNKQSTGYYRINYDDQNWLRIIEGLTDRPHKIHPRNRAQLINDAYRLSASNRLSHSTLMSILTYLPKEDQYAPLASANSVLNVFNRYLSTDSEYSQLKYFISELVKAQYDKFGVNDVPGEHHLAKFSRNVLINLACLAGVQSCLDETRAKLTAFINDHKPIEPNLQAQVYCNALKQSGNTEFDFLYNKLMDSKDQAERRLLISSLGCAQDAKQINKFISSSIDMTNKLRTQERITLLSPAYSRGDVGLTASIEFLNENWEAYGNLNSGFGGTNPLISDIIGISQYVVNDIQKNKLLELVQKIKGSAHDVPNLQSAVESNIASNYQWLAINRDPIMSWVGRYRTGGSASVTASVMSVTFTVLLVAARFLNF